MSYSKKRTYSQMESSTEWIQEFCAVADLGKNAVKIFVCIIGNAQYGNVTYLTTAEISRIIGISPQAASLALSKLQGIDAIRKHLKGRKVVGYRINPFISCKTSTIDDVSLLKNNWLKLIS